VLYRSGDRTVSLGLNGLSFLVRGGVSMGRPVLVDKPRRGDVVSVGATVTVDSKVEGDVWVFGADAVLRPRAEVSGNVVAIGGTVVAEPRSTVKGSVNQLPELKIPFLGMLGTQFSVLSLQLGREILEFLLLAAALFIATFYFENHARGLFHSLQREWRLSLLTAALAIAIVPLLAALLIASLLGIFFLPVLAFLLALASIDGLLALCSRVGAWLRRAGSDAPGESLFLFTSGLLGLFLLKAPALAGIVLGLAASDTAVRIGEILRVVSLALSAAGLLYGFGATLAHVRSRPVRSKK